MDRACSMRPSKCEATASPFWPPWRETVSPCSTLPRSCAVTARSRGCAWSTHSDSSEWDIIPSFLRTCFVFLVMFFDGYMYMIQLLLSDVLPTRRTLEATVDGRQNHHLEEAFAVRGWVQGLNIALLN